LVVPRPAAPVPFPHRVIFFGTPTFAVPTLNALAEDGRFSVELVVTQPPRPSGRGRHEHRSAVHMVAEGRGLPVFAPERLRGPEVIARLTDCEPTLFVVAAYGKILRPDVLAIPDHGTLNVHASLLPKYRGASPITAAILDGEAASGVTIMLMDVGLDTGPILSQATVPIPPDATTASLTYLLGALGAPLLADTTARWLLGEIEPELQDDAMATMTRLIAKEDGAVDWRLPARRLERMERAYSPWPGIFTTFAGKRLILHGLRSTEGRGQGTPGVVLEATDAGIRVATGYGDLLIERVQPEGKAEMSALAFANGRPHLIGSRLGESLDKDISR
jgi:methionyl-tRNA formyltransferase